MATEESTDYEKSLPLQLGALRSQMQLTIHTHHAMRLWRGRPTTDENPGILGLNGFLAITNKMIRGVQQDDPYSDWWMLRVEQKIEHVKARFAVIKEELDFVYSQLPPSMSLGENVNLQPATLAVFASSPLGFLAIYLLADFDEIVRRILLAIHTALIDRNTHDLNLDDAAHELRSLFAMVQRYRYSGATREDFAMGNAVAQAAIEKYGEVPQDILEGKRRSRYAPRPYQRIAQESVPHPEAEEADRVEGAFAIDEETMTDDAAEDESLDEAFSDSATMDREEE